MNERPYFTIIVPVYNVKEYLPAAIDSLCRQSFSDIEILLVDDGSDDGSRAVCTAAAEGDARIKVVCHEKNKGLYQARRTGVENANGRYILFLDSDDELGADALEYLYGELEKSPVDILAFGFNVIASGAAVKKEADIVAAASDAFAGELPGEGLVDKCYIERKFIWSMAGKAYDGNLMKKAYVCMPRDARINMSEDLFQNFIILHFANSYRGVSGRRYYYYYFGRGMTSGEDKAEMFRRVCEERTVVESIAAFLRENGLSEKYQKAFDTIKRNIVRIIVYAWAKQSESERSESYDALASMAEAADIIMTLAHIAEEANEGAVQAHELRKELDVLRQSSSLKAGLALTAIPRAVKRAARGRKNA